MSCRFFILRRFYSGVPPVGGASPSGDIRKRQDGETPE
jgi:hypothetical protein